MQCWVCFALALCPLSHAQAVAEAAPEENGKRLSFEVASVKQIDPAKQIIRDPIGPNENGLRLVSDLSFFIEQAYEVEGLQVVGLPA